MSKANHLYIHLPFCKSICYYCDFCRFANCENKIDEYINKVILEIKNNVENKKLKSIYIGGGTPNFLKNEQLEKLFIYLQKYISPTTEFTIECNPEFINKQQIDLFAKYKINRVSLGVQILNDDILKKMNRHHKSIDCINAIKTIQNKIKNISCDFIYGFNSTTFTDLDNDLKFIIKYKIPHVSFYSLEIKEGSILNKNNYQLNDNLISDQLEYLENKLNKTSYKRYEVSNWCIDKKYQSVHNKAYWNSNDWIGIGLGAWGLENRFYYENKGNIDSWKKIGKTLNDKNYYFQVISMGLRMCEGINLKNKLSNDAYLFFKKKIDYSLITISNNWLKAKNINLLNEILIKLI